MIEAPATNAVRRLSGRYALLEKLGAGGQGEVWRAHDTPRGLEVALKVLNPPRARVEAAWSALEREYAAVSRLSHPGILGMFAPERDGDTLLLPMELATGGDLRQLRGGSYLQIVPALLEVATALEHAHERGVVHRDLKPGNVLRDSQGHWRLADFGVASNQFAGADATTAGLSPFTASPEQLLGEAPSPSDDLYGLGALAYELLSGYPPHYPRFEMKRVLDDPAPPLQPLQQAPPQLVALVMRMLSKRAQMRPASMREVIDELDAALNDTLTFDTDGEGQELPLDDDVEVMTPSDVAGDNVSVTGSRRGFPSSGGVREPKQAARAPVAPPPSRRGAADYEPNPTWTAATFPDVDAELEATTFLPPPKSREPARESLRESAGDSVREPLRDAGRESVREPLRDTGRESVREPARDAGRESVREPARDAGRESVREPARDAGRESVREPLRDAAREATPTPTRSSPVTARVSPSGSAEHADYRERVPEWARDSRLTTSVPAGMGAGAAVTPPAASSTRRSTAPAAPPGITPPRATPPSPASQTSYTAPVQRPAGSTAATLASGLTSPSPAAQLPYAAPPPAAALDPAMYAAAATRPTPEQVASETPFAAHLAPSVAEQLHAHGSEFLTSVPPALGPASGDVPMAARAAAPDPLREAARQMQWDNIRIESVPSLMRLEKVKPRRWPGVLLILLVLGAAAAFYLAPRYAPDLFIAKLSSDLQASATDAIDDMKVSPTVVSDEPVATVPTPPPVATAAGATDADVEKIRDVFAEKLNALEARGAGVWGGRDLATAKTRAAEAVGASDAGNPQLAHERLTDAVKLLNAVETRAGQTLAAQLTAGERALDNGQAEVATQAFETARRIDSGNKRAADGLRRAQNLTGVLPLLAAAGNAESARDYSRALQDYNKALALDPNNAKAREGVARANAALGNDAYAKAVGAGFAALGAGRPEEARDAFERARSIRPNGQEAAQGLSRATAALRSRGYAGARQRGAALEAEERWVEALEEYETALRADPSLAFAQEGQVRAAARADLSNRLQDLIERPERLAAAEVRSEALSLLDRADNQAPYGPVLRSQVARLQILLPDFDKPVRLSMVSDNATQVAIQRIGAFGTFSQREVELKPGKYTVVGTRAGFRDVRRDITVSPGQDVQTISVRCVEPI